jgi:phage tail-like protein
VSRGLIGGLRSPHPLGPHLPPVLLAETQPDGGAVDAPFPLGAYVNEIGVDDLQAEEGDGSAPAEQLAGYWVLGLQGDARAGGGPLRVALWREGRAVATGTLSVAGRRATFMTSDCAKAEGVYEWALDGDRLQLVVVDDGCVSRRLVLTANSWQRQSFVVRLMSAFDDALAPVFATLDNLDAYVDPRVAPHDFVDWLSGWVGLAPNHAWQLRQRRERIAGEARLAVSWGTAEGIKEVVSIFAGVPQDDVEVAERGGPPEAPVPTLLVRVRVPNASSFDVVRLRRVVGGAKPAHLPHEVEVLGK